MTARWRIWTRAGNGTAGSGVASGWGLGACGMSVFEQVLRGWLLKLLGNDRCRWCLRKWHSPAVASFGVRVRRGVALGRLSGIGAEWTESVASLAVLLLGRYWLLQ